MERIPVAGESMSKPPTVTDADIAALQSLGEAFERWRAIPASRGSLRAAAEAELNERLDALDATPDSWHGLKELVGVIDDRVMAELMRYSLKRSDGQVREMLRGLDHEPPFPNPPLTKRRRRERER